MDSLALIQLYKTALGEAASLVRAQNAIKLTRVSEGAIRRQLRAAIDEATLRLESIAERLASHCTGLTAADWLHVLLCQDGARARDLRCDELIRLAFFHLKNSNDPEVRPLGYMVAAA
jgi:hypothetical protein